MFWGSAVWRRVLRASKVGRWIWWRHHWDQAKRIRNVGILAHVDAGKTTITERFLYFAGATSRLGNVDDGNTVTDFMEQERTRGITINSATVTFPWKEFTINLIDTPGHVDFTMEVERALMALDGAALVLDASAGVQAQTLTVYRQAARFSVPLIAFVNKMDKPNADWASSLASIESNLGIKALPIQMPLGSGSSYRGVVDLVRLERWSWAADGGDGRRFARQRLSAGDAEWGAAMEARRALAETLADHSDELANVLLHDGDLAAVDAAPLLRALAKATHRRALLPVLCGAALRNIAVHNLLDAAVALLPAPHQRQPTFLAHFHHHLCALVFKILHTAALAHQHGLPAHTAVTFVRLYQGTITKGQTVYNVTRGRAERVERVLLVNADQFKEIASVHAGEIAGLVGLSSSITGDTLTSTEHPEHATALQHLHLLHVPEPVFHCTVEAPSAARQHQFDDVLQRLQREDPTLRCFVHADSGETVMQGMGQLHLEIVKDRIHKEYGLEIFMGPLQVSFKETLRDVCETAHQFQRSVDGQQHVVHVALSLSGRSADHERLKVVATSENELSKLKPPHLAAIHDGIHAAFASGPLAGAPIANVQVTLTALTWKPHRLKLPFITAAVFETINRALKEHVDAVELLEPFVRVEMDVAQSHSTAVLNDLHRRRAQIERVSSTGDAQQPGTAGVHVVAVAPLAELLTYSTDLRIVSSGRAEFTMHPVGYERVPPELVPRLLRRPPAS